MENRDWYRDEVKHRRDRAQNMDQSMRSTKKRTHQWKSWVGATNPGRLPFGPLCWVAVIATCVLVVSKNGAEWEVSWAGRPDADQQLPAAAYPVVEFPANGTTNMFIHPDPAALAPLTVQTSAISPSQPFVVSVRDWFSNKVVATLYLDANTVVTVDLQAGQYRIFIASGKRWGGDQVLFGPTTRVEQVRDPINLARYGARAIGRVLYFMDTANPNLTSDRVPRSRFSTQ
jgi:hypothetical protein